MATKGTFDTAFDNIVTALEEFAVIEKAINSAYDYTVFPDYYRQQPPTDAGAYMFVYLGPITPNTEKSTHRYMGYNAVFYIDCVAVAKGTQGTTYSRADAAAGARMRYLIQQALTAIFQASETFLSLPGQIGKKPFPRVEPLPPEMQMGERPLVGARITLDIDFAWEPGTPAGTAIDSITVDAGQFTALFEP